MAAATGSATDTAPRAIWHADIATGYERLLESTRALDQATQRFCDAPSASALDELKGDWRDAFFDWQRVRFVDFGPIDLDSRAWQFQFWPDSKNLVARKADYWLSDGRTATSEAIAGGSIAVQGFPALEYLLFDASLAGRGIKPSDAQACALLTAIAGHLAQEATEVNQEWQAFATFYKTTDTLTDTTIHAAMTGLEILVDRRLASPLGLRGTPQVNPYAADAWRSGVSLGTLRASIEGMKRYFAPGLRALLAERGLDELIAPLDEQLASTLAEIQALEKRERSLGEMLETQEGYADLQSLFIEASQLKQLINGRIAAALGVVTGFNSSDGD
ncbi:imelysin family protein [Modicisalibacter muralis]|nr:imelysin family protein [Halomonas muralis]